MTDTPSTPHDVVRPLLRVRQVREFETDGPIDSDLLDAIADAGRWSGSASNSQPWRFIVIRDADILRGIAASGLPSTRSLETAPAAIAIAMRVEEGRAVSHAFDEGRAAERLLVAATLVGLGAGLSWVGSAGRPAVARLLGVPDGWVVKSVIALGHPTRAASHPKSRPGEARLPRHETVFAERWPG